MNTPHTVSDDRLAQIVDGDVTAFAYEVPAIAAELLARRAGDRQREAAKYDGPDVPDGPVSEGFAPGFEERGGKP